MEFKKEDLDDRPKEDLEKMTDAELDQASKELGIIMDEDGTVIQNSYDLEKSRRLSMKSDPKPDSKE